MASFFDSNFATTPWGVLTAFHGESVTYTPHGGSPSTITVIWTPEGVAPDASDDTSQVPRRGVVKAKPSDVTGPEKGDKFTINSEVYVLKEVLGRLPYVTLEVVLQTSNSLGVS